MGKIPSVVIFNRHKQFIILNSWEADSSYQIKKKLDEKGMDKEYQRGKKNTWINEGFVSSTVNG